MKKINLLCLILALVMVIGLFAGCGSEKPADTTAAPVADDDGTPAPVVDDKDYKYGSVHGITWTWGGTADKADLTAVQREEERNAMYYLDTGNTRECVPFTYNYDTVGALFEGGQMPTIFNVAATEPQRLIMNGWGRDITACVEAVGINLADFNQGILETYMDEEGKLYGLPVDGYAMCLYGHGGLYKEAGLVDANGEPVPPKTWDEVIEHAEIIREKTGKGGIALQATDNQGGWIFSNIAWNYGADLCVLNEETGKYVSNVNTPEVISALEWWKKACNSPALSGTPSTDNLNANMAMFKSGEASHFVVHPGVIGNLTAIDKDGMNPKDVYCFNMPAGPDGLQYNLLGGSGRWFSSNATDEQVIAALEYCINYGLWTQEWTEAARNSDITGWKDAAAKSKIVLPYYPVYNYPYHEEYVAELQKIMADVYDYDKQMKTMYEHTSVHPEEEVECQNLYAELTAILQEIAVNPDADCAAMAEQAHNNYQALLDIAQGD